MMVNNDTDSHLMLPSTIFRITWTPLIFFLVPFWCSLLVYLPSRSFPYPSATEHSPCFNQVSHLVCLGYHYFLLHYQ